MCLPPSIFKEAKDIKAIKKLLGIEYLFNLLVSTDDENWNPVETIE